MKIELIKKSDEKGQLAYYVYKDGSYVSGTVEPIYPGNEDAALERAIEHFKKVKEAPVEPVNELIYSEEL